MRQTIDINNFLFLIRYFHSVQLNVEQSVCLYIAKIVQIVVELVDEY